MSHDNQPCHSVIVKPFSGSAEFGPYRTMSSDAKRPGSHLHGWPAERDLVGTEAYEIANPVVSEGSSSESDVRDGSAEVRSVTDTSFADLQNQYVCIQRLKSASLRCPPG